MYNNGPRIDPSSTPEFNSIEAEMSHKAREKEMSYYHYIQIK